VVHCNKCRTIWTQPEEAAREVERDRSRLPAGETQLDRIEAGSACACACHDSHQPAEAERDRSRLPAGEWTASERVRLAAAVHKWVYLHPPMRPWTPALVDSLLDALAAALPPVPSEGDAK
jgi:hypothetical protein